MVNITFAMAVAALIGLEDAAHAKPHPELPGKPAPQLQGGQAASSTASLALLPQFHASYGTPSGEQ